MGTLKITLLPKKILRISGPDKLDFLQGLITADLTKLTPTLPLYGALLSAQGRYLFDFIIYMMKDDYLLEVDNDRLDALQKKLSLYKLRAQVTLSPDETLGVYALFDGLKHPPLPHLYPDPRLPELGWRLIGPKGITLPETTPVSHEVYDLYRLKLGIPDGERDMPLDKAIPLECGLDELHAISWTKGCYLGQELTSRTKYTGIVRKRLMLVTCLKGMLPEPDTELMWQGQKIGVMRSHTQNHGLALIRLEFLTEHPDGILVTHPDYTLKITRPFWSKS